MTDKEQSDFDSPWKDILESYFMEFMSFFFLKAYNDIDGNLTNLVIIYGDSE